MATEKQNQYISDLCEQLNQERDFNDYFAMRVAIHGGEERITYIDSYKTDAKEEYPSFKASVEPENNKCLELINNWAKSNTFEVEEASEMIRVLKRLAHNQARRIHHIIKKGCDPSDIEDGIYDPSEFYKKFGTQIAQIHFDFQ